MHINVEALLSILTHQSNGHFKVWWSFEWSTSKLCIIHSTLLAFFGSPYDLSELPSMDWRWKVVTQVISCTKFQHRLTNSYRRLYGTYEVNWSFGTGLKRSDVEGGKRVSISHSGKVQGRFFFEVEWDCVLPNQSFVLSHGVILLWWDKPWYHLHLQTPR